MAYGRVSEPYAVSHTLKRRLMRDHERQSKHIESFSTACLEGDDRSDALSLVHKIEGLVNFLQGKPVRDHRINLDLAA